MKITIEATDADFRKLKKMAEDVGKKLQNPDTVMMLLRMLEPYTKATTQPTGAKPPKAKKSRRK